MYFGYVVDIMATNDLVTQGALQWRHNERHGVWNHRHSVYPPQKRTSTAENVSICWRHHGMWQTRGIDIHMTDLVFPEYSGPGIRKNNKLLCNDVAHWLGAILEPALEYDI